MFRNTVLCDDVLGIISSYTPYKFIYECNEEGKISSFSVKIKCDFCEMLSQPNKDCDKYIKRELWDREKTHFNKEVLNQYIWSVWANGSLVINPSVIYNTPEMKMADFLIRNRDGDYEHHKITNDYLSLVNKITRIYAGTREYKLLKKQFIKNYHILVETVGQELVDRVVCSKYKICYVVCSSCKKDKYLYVE
jgi:hypothetical protein